MLSKKKPCIFAGLLTAVSVGTALSLSLTPASAMESSSISAVSAGAADSQTLSSQDGPSVSVDELHSPAASNADASVNGANKGQGQVVKGKELAGDQNETGSPSGSNSQNSVETVDASEKNSDQDAAASVPQDSGTSNASESSKASASSEKTFTAGWNQIDGTYYWYENGSTAAKTGWLVTGDSLDGTKGGLQRYWLDASTGALRFNSLISAADAGWWAYSTDKGYVARGRYTAADGTVYLADNDGRLEDAGWHVTSGYGQGLQRYYVDSDKHGCVEGYSSDGYAHYTTSDGYVLRGSMKVGDKVYLADNDGRLARSGNSASGWVVTSAYGQGLQRYWVEGHDGSDGGYARVGFSKDGWNHYTTSAGYVLRGASDEAGVKRYANNDGNVYDGWIVTSAFTGGLERFYQKGGSLLRSTFFNDGGWWAYASDSSVVLRGVRMVSNGVVLADNDGKIAGGDTGGWLVSGAYGQGLQRYYLEKTDEGYCLAKPGYSAQGWSHYTTDGGYVLRGILKVGDKVYLADNDGCLARNGKSESGWLVTSAYGQGLQRYWVEGHDGNDGGYARVGFSKDGWAHYTADAGYVIRWKMDMGSLKVLANGDGAIADQAGWLVTSQYDSGVQRYWLEEIPGQAGFFGSKMGLFNVDGKRYYGRYDTGYVVRGVYVISSYYAAPSGDDYNSYHTDTIAVANSDGVLLSRAEVGAMVVAAARTQLGCSYTYVNSGYFPGDSFNCSGLSWWAYNAALGINLSHNQGYWSYYARQDNRNNSQVYGVDKRGGWTTSENNLVPGDLVFFSPVGNKYSTGHVGIYIGDGCMIDSYPGPGVSVRSIYQSGYVGGGCPITVI